MAQVAEDVLEKLERDLLRLCDPLALDGAVAADAASSITARKRVVRFGRDPHAAIVAEVAAAALDEPRPHGVVLSRRLRRRTSGPPECHRRLRVCTKIGWCVSDVGQLTAFGAATARAGSRSRRADPPHRRVAAGSQDRLAGHGATEAEDVGSCARLRGERDATGLSGDAAVGPDERPLHGRRSTRAGGTGRALRTGGPCRTCRTGCAARELPRLEVTCQQRVVLDLDAPHAVPRQRLAGRIAGAPECQQQCEAADDHRRRRREPLDQTHV